MADARGAVLHFPRQARVTRAHSIERACRIFLWLAIGIYLALALPLTFNHLDRFAMMAFDLGIFDQAVWLISRGETPFVTVHGLHILGDHFSAVLYLLAPLYWLWESPKVLLAAQSLALASGALPVYALAHAQTRSAGTALLFAVCYLLYPALQWSNLAEFHPDTFATPLLLGAFYYLTRKRWRPYFALLGLALLTKETVGLTVMALGLYTLAIDRRVGWLTLGIGAAMLFTALAAVRYFNGGEPSSYFWLYARYGSHPFDILWNLVTHPSAAISDLMTAEPKQRYLLGLLQPVLFLPLLAPKVFAIAAPALLANLLCSRSAAFHIESYHAAAVTPVIFAAAIVGFARLRRRATPALAGVLLVNLGVWAAAGSWFLGPLGMRGAPLYPPVSSAEAAEIRDLLVTIPPGASVSAQSALVPHLSRRKAIYTFPNPFYQRAWGGTIQARREIEMEPDALQMGVRPEHAVGTAPVEYVLLCPPTLRFPLQREEYVEFATAILRSPSYGIVSIGRSVVLLQRGAAHPRGLALLEGVSGVRIRRAGDVEKALESWMGNQRMAP